jgi:hypothetical protein
MRFVLSGATLASIDRVRSGAMAANSNGSDSHGTDSHRTDSHGAHQVAASRSSSRFIEPSIAEDSCKRRMAAGLAALSET